MGRTLVDGVMARSLQYVSDMDIDMLIKGGDKAKMVEARNALVKESVRVVCDAANAPRGSAYKARLLVEARLIQAQCAKINAVV